MRFSIAFALAFASAAVEALPVAASEVSLRLQRLSNDRDHNKTADTKPTE